MHVAFLLTQSLSSPSGLGRYWPVSKELVRLGYEVTVIALHHDLALAERRRFTQDGVRVWYVSQMHVRKVGDRKLYFSPARTVAVSAAATWHLTWAALRTPADVYHVAKPHPMNSIAGYIASRVKGKPLLVDCDDYEAASGRFSTRWQRQIIAAFEDWMPRLARGVTVNTRFMMERLRDLGVSSDRIVYVPNGVDRARFARNLPSDGIRKAYGLDEGEDVIVYVGTLSMHSHPVDLLLDAFARVVQSGCKAVLLIVGAGEDYDSLRERTRSLALGDRVHFAGRVSPEEVPAYLALATVSVDPVRDDDTAAARSPLKIVESIAARVPVVTGDIGDRAMVLCDGRLGILVPPGDSEVLAQGLMALLRDPQKRYRMAEAAAAERERWYWDRLVHRFVRVYGADGA